MRVKLDITIDLGRDLATLPLGSPKHADALVDAVIATLTDLLGAKPLGFNAHTSFGLDSRKVLP